MIELMSLDKILSQPDIQICRNDKFIAIGSYNGDPAVAHAYRCKELADNHQRALNTLKGSCISPELLDTTCIIYNGTIWHVVIEEKIKGKDLRTFKLNEDLFTEIGTTVATLHQYYVIHGDLWHGNFIKDLNSTHLKIIDYEHATISSKIADMANDLLILLLNFADLGEPYLHLILEGYLSKKSLPKNYVNYLEKEINAMSKCYEQRSHRILL